jgi:regulation of enolase protein 1 (concanavalin A-like superfamily)
MANSEIILSNQVHPGDSVSNTVTGEKYRGDGYYGRSDGFHTVQVNLTEFIGTIEVQGTLAINPSDNDWFKVSLGKTSSETVVSTVDTTGLVSSSTTSIDINYIQNETSVRTYNFTGNYVWLRVKVLNWTGGTINSIALNH